MVSHEPLNRFHDRSFNKGVTLSLEEPDASGTGNYELAASNNERVHPEESEYLVEENVSSFVFPLNFCKEWVSFTSFGSSYREYPEDLHEP
jgi:hypothetical protein